MLRRYLPQALVLMLAAMLPPGALAEPPHGQREQAGNNGQAHANNPSQPRGNGDRSQSQGKSQQVRLTAQEAAAKARAQHGGRVLKVSPQGRGYRVRLLGDDGRVITVTVED